jgi:hypothetical protein
LYFYKKNIKDYGSKNLLLFPHLDVDYFAFLLGSIGFLDRPSRFGVEYCQHHRYFVGSVDFKNNLIPTKKTTHQMNELILIFIIACIAISSFFESEMDILTHDYQRSLAVRFGWSYYFWNPTISWRNKWKNGNKEDGEDYWGSSTFFVWRTDGWHLCKFLRNRFFSLALTVAVYQDFTHKGFWVFVITYVVLGVAQSLFFELFYSKLR